MGVFGVAHLTRWRADHYDVATQHQLELPWHLCGLASRCGLPCHATSGVRPLPQFLGSDPAATTQNPTNFCTHLQDHMVQAISMFFFQVSWPQKRLPFSSSKGPDLRTLSTSASIRTLGGMMYHVEIDIGLNQCQFVVMNMPWKGIWI